MAESEKSKWTRPILLIALAVPLSLFFFLYYGAEQRFEHVPFQYEDIPDGDTVYHTLPAFSMVRVNGDTITDEDLRGRITLMSFFSVDDDADLKTTVLLGNLQRSYDNVDWDMDPPFLFISVNTGDSSAAVRAFRDEIEADPSRWWMLYGPQTDVLKLGAESFYLDAFVGKAPGFEPFTAQQVALIDKAGRVRKYYTATDLQEERNIQEDLIALLRLDYPEEIERMQKN